jgi:hypothetical protein
MGNETQNSAIYAENYHNIHMRFITQIAKCFAENGRTTSKIVITKTLFPDL